MRTSCIRMVPVLALVLAAGCFPFRRTVFYSEPAEAAAPTRHVFELCRQWIAPVPDAAKGWCFRLSVRPELVREGAVLTLPGEGARPLLRVIRAPSISESRDATGTVRILRVEPHRILAAVDLEDRSDLANWSLRRNVWFRRGQSLGPPTPSPEP